MGAGVREEGLGGLDFKPVKTKTIVFKQGQRQKFVVIGTYPDTASEGNETVTATLSDASPGLTISRGLGTLTILNDD